MRLTERKVCFPQCDKQGNLTKVDYIEIKDKKLAEQKLCQLEDIEEELGIDLITLFKALKNGIYKKGEHNICFDTKLRFMKNEFYLAQPFDENYQYIVKTKDYGKTWALTKEELL